MSNLRVFANKEMASEKARLSGRRRQTVSALEKAAQQWMLEQEQSERKQREEEQVKKSEETSFEGVSQADFTEATQDIVGEMGWHQFNPGVAEGMQEQKPVSLNSATVHAISKKLIAREWRRARGKPRRDLRTEQLLRETGSWVAREKSEQIKKEKEEAEKQRLKRYVRGLNDVLMEFASQLSDETNESDSISIEEMFEECLRDLFNPYDVEWYENGCRIWFEPWEEIRARRIAKVTEPAVYTALIDRGMNITSFTRDN